MARTPEPPTKTVNILYETFYSGAIGGSVVALLFLVADTLTGRPFYTPSLLGSTMFQGVDPATVTGMRLDAVALYTPVHFIVFGVLGLIGSILVRTMEARIRRPVWVTLILFGLMQAAFLLGLRTLTPGAPALLGYARAGVINLFAAVAMVLFLHWVRRQEESFHRAEETEEQPASSTT
jgi:hypothetical protein